MSDIEFGKDILVEISKIGRKYPSTPSIEKNRAIDH